MGMTNNIDKSKIMIIKSKKITYDNLIYDDNYLEELPSYKYLRIDINHQFNWNYNIEKMISRRWKSYYEIENNCKTTNFEFGIIKVYL